MRSLLSRLTISTVGLSSKAFLRLGCASVTVKGLPTLLDALEDARRNERGILTVTNHISVLDDPVAWGVLPASCWLSSRKTRWTLGAADIMFTNPISSAIFRSGQVIETFRGQGIWQPAIDDAIRKLDTGEWIHIFPEGKVNQILSEQAELLRFKWGVGRMLMEARHTPLIIPMWLTGFDQVMNENRSFPRFLPRIGKNITITFGDPVSVTQQVEALRAKHLEGDFARDDPHTTEMRIRLTRLVQEEVERLGYSAISKQIDDVGGPTVQ